MVFRQRSEAAFESLYARHAREVYGYALAMLGTPADAEDVTQTTFLNAYRAYQRGERPSKPRGWLFAIALNVCRQRWRQASRRPHEVSLDDSFAVADEPDGPSAQDIARALQALPFNQRAALVMRELEGRRQTEIAEELGVSVSAVETLLFRARRGVREQLESALTCGEAARAISRQLDDGASRADRAALRAHLRVCPECATFARRARAQRSSLRGMRLLPLPAALLPSWGGGAAVGTSAGGLAAKLIAGTAVVALAAGAGDVAINHHHARDGAHRGAAAVAAPRAAAVEPVVAKTAKRAVPRQEEAAHRTASPQPRKRPAWSHAKKPAAPPGLAKRRTPPPGHAKKQAATRVPPGQAVKQATTAPPGQAKRQATTTLSRGQAKKQSVTTTIPRGQAKKPSIPSGQADKGSDTIVAAGEPKKDAGSSAPPGQAKKQDKASGGD